MSNLSHFFLGLTNEWLESMTSIMAASGATGGGGSQGQFPVNVNGVCEFYSLSKLFKTLSAAMPNCRVKILKMSAASTCKQFLQSLC